MKGATSRVLQVGKYYPPVEGGIESHVHALATAMARRYDVTALVFNTDRRTVRETMEGVRVVRVGTFGKLLSTEMAPTFFGWFLRLRHRELIHLHTPNPIGELACLAAPRSVRLVVTYHSDVVRQRLLGRLNRFVLHRLMRRADRIIAFTRRYMETSPVISLYAAKCAIIPHGIDLSEYDVDAAIEARASALRAETGPRIALFVGRLVYYKGVDVLLNALALVPDLRLIVVGDGPTRDSLTSMARDLGLGERVRFMGRVSHEEKVACYRASDFLVLPATHRSEAFGLVQLEAQACGIPVITTDIDSGVPFVTRDGETGLIVPPGDPESLASAMATLSRDAGMRRRYGAAGRRRVEELFSREVMTRDCLRLYEDLLQESGPPAPGREAEQLR